MLLIPSPVVVAAAATTTSEAQVKDGAEALRNSTWWWFMENTTAHHRTWDGITCNRKRHVIGITYSLNSYYQHSGKLSQLKFSSFPCLLHLNLCYYYIYGGILADIGNLTKFTYLRISDCLLDGEIPVPLGTYGLSGVIPSSLGYLKNLIHLNLGYNYRLSGLIPSSLGNLTNLKYLNLGRNEIQGSIPYQIGNLKNLIHLDLSSNSLSSVKQQYSFGL